MSLVFPYTKYCQFLIEFFVTGIYTRSYWDENRIWFRFPTIISLSNSMIAVVLSRKSLSHAHLWKRNYKKYYIRRTDRITGHSCAYTSYGYDSRRTIVIYFYEFVHRPAEVEYWTPNCIRFVLIHHSVMIEKHLESNEQRGRMK